MKIKFGLKMVFFVFLCAINLNAQAPAIQWEKRFGGTWADVAYSVDTTSDGGYILAGRTESNDGNVSGNKGAFDYWVVKLNSSGTLQWQKTLGGSLNDFAYSVKQTSDGGYIVAGESESTNGDVTGNHGGYDGWIVKLNSTGTLEWQKTFGSFSSDSISSIQQTSDGGYIVAATTFQSSSDYWIIKLNASGTIEWQKIYGGSDADITSTIRQTSDGGYIVAGHTLSNDGNVTGNHGEADFWILKLNTLGDFQWQKTLGGTKEDMPSSIQQTSDGGYIVSGLTWSSNGDVTGFHGVYDYWVVKLNATGNLEWQKALGGSRADAANSITQTSDGGYLVVGDTVSNNGDVSGFHNALDSDYWDIWIAKLNSSGVLQWKKVLGGDIQDLATCIKPTADGGFVVTGSTNSSNGDISGTSAGQGIDYWIVKFAPEDLAVAELEKSILTLYPNPVKNELTVKLDFFMPSQKIIVTDILGKVIYTQDAQDLITTINTSDLSKGTYFLTLQNEGKKTTQKFIVE